jgi:peptidoglycan/xylan/chitin deacetylase (PgdA/CDA1 family)
LRRKGTRIARRLAVLHLAKRGSAALMTHTGVTRWVSRTAWRRSRLLILCYHGVSLEDEHVWAPLLFVSVARLERRLQILQRHGCSILPLAEALERVRRSDLPDRAVALTFDDGYYNFAARAVAVLRAWSLPATVYLPTLRCSHNFPVTNLVLSYGLWRHRSSTLAARSLPGLADGDYPLGTAAERERITGAIRAEAARRQLTYIEKDGLVRQVFESFGGDYDAFVRNRRLSLLNPEEVSRLSAAGVDFQLHTHRHSTPVDAQQFAAEVRQNRACLEEMTGVASRHFCYPSGVYRTSYLPVLRAERIESATTCDPGLVTAACEPLLLKRFVDNERVSETEFEAWLSGAASWLPHLPTRTGDVSV